MPKRQPKKYGELAKNSRAARERAVAESRRRESVPMYLRGSSLADIAKKFGVSPSAISHDIQAARKAWKEKNALAYGDYLDEELARLDLIESTAWEAWERSRLAEERIVTTTKGQAVRKVVDGRLRVVQPETTTTKTVTGQAGDPRFLTVVMDCIEKRMKLLGVGKEEPEKPTIAVQVVEVVMDTREQWLDFESFRERMNGRTNALTVTPQPAGDFAEASGVSPE